MIAIQELKKVYCEYFERFYWESILRVSSGERQALSWCTLKKSIIRATARSPNIFAGEQRLLLQNYNEDPSACAGNEKKGFLGDKKGGRGHRGGSR